MTNIYSRLPQGPQSSNAALVQALGEWFVQDHRDCDNLWVAVEEGATHARLGSMLWSSDTAVLKGLDVM